jgi:hypothetical protein
MALIGWPSTLGKPLPTRPIKLQVFFSIFLPAVLNNYANFLSSSLINESLEHVLSAKTTRSSSNRIYFKHLPWFIMTCGNPGDVVHTDWPSSWRWLARIMQIYRRLFNGQFSGIQCGFCTVVGMSAPLIEHSWVVRTQLPWTGKWHTTSTTSQSLKRKFLLARSSRVFVW